MTEKNPRGAGRRPGSPNKKPRGKRITPTINQETLEWLTAQPDSYGKAIDRAVKAFKTLEDEKQATEA
jgi:hypothetical protein